MSELFDMPSDPVEPGPKPLDDQIRLVRLVTGEDILCVLREDFEQGETKQANDNIILSTPLKLVMHRVTPLRPASAIAIGITAWLPDELLDCHEVAVKIGHIVTVMEPKEELKAYYKKTVDIIQSNIIIGDKSIRNDITKASIDAQRQVEEVEVASTQANNTVSMLKGIQQARMQEVLERLNEIDEYLMAHGNEEGPITFH